MARTGRDAAAGGIDVKMNVLFRLRHLEEQQLGDDQVGDHVIHGRAEENNAIHQQARIDVISAFAASGLLDYHWD